MFSRPVISGKLQAWYNTKAFGIPAQVERNARIVERFLDQETLDPEAVAKEFKLSASQAYRHFVVFCYRVFPEFDSWNRPSRQDIYNHREEIREAYEEHCRLFKFSFAKPRLHTFTIIYYEEPNHGPGDYLRATVVAEDHNAAFNKFRDEHPVAGDDDEDSDVEADEDDEDLPERINIICAIEGDLDVHWNYD